MTNTVSAVQNSVGTLAVDLNSYFNDASSVQFSCSGMPANSVCRGPSGSIAMTANGVSPEQIQFITNVPPQALSAASVPVAPGQPGWWFGGAGLCLLVGMPLWRRRSRFAGVLFGLLLLAGFAGLSGAPAIPRATRRTRRRLAYMP